eukprot:367552-Amphidinium_carterae.1
MRTNTRDCEGIDVNRKQNVFASNSYFDNWQDLTDAIPKEKRFPLLIRTQLGICPRLKSLSMAATKVLPALLKNNNRGFYGEPRPPKRH